MYSIFTKHPRDSKQRFTTKRARNIKRIGYLALVTVGVYFIWGHPIVMETLDKELYANNAVAVAQEIEPEPVNKFSGITTGEIENMLIQIVWEEESTGYRPQDGKLFKVFDPSDSMWEACTKQFNRILDCDSYGPMQIKIGTLRGMWKQMYGEEISEIDALLITQDLELSQKFFVDCSVLVKGCAWNWTGAKNHPIEVQLLVDQIRTARGISL